MRQPTGRGSHSRAIAEGGRSIASPIPPNWLTRPIAIVLSLRRARALLAAVRADHVNLGGRYSIRGTAKLIVIWSTAAGQRPAPIGGFRLERPGPGEAARITQLAWDPFVDAAEATVLAAVQRLVGAVEASSDQSVDAWRRRPFDARPGRRSPGTRYSDTFKRAAIARVVAGTQTVRQVCDELGIDLVTMRRWRKEYES